MAVDTRDRRMSMLGLAQPVPSMLPNPDGTIGTQDRAMLLWLYHGITLDTPAAFVVPFSILATMQTIQGHLMSGGGFVSVQLGQPSTVAPALTGITAAIWLEHIQVGTVFLGVVDKIYEVTVRLYTNMLAEPQEQGELDLALTVQDIGSDLLGDFTLGTSVRNIDAAGIYGTPLGAQWGYTSVAGVMFRTVDITVPIIVNDSIALTA